MHFYCFVVYTAIGLMVGFLLILIITVIVMNINKSYYLVVLITNRPTSINAVPTWYPTVSTVPEGYPSRAPTSPTHNPTPPTHRPTPPPKNYGLFITLAVP